MILKKKSTEEKEKDKAVLFNFTQKHFMKKILSLSLFCIFTVYAQEEIRWNDQIFPLSHWSYYKNRYETLKYDVEMRFDKYFNNYPFTYWNDKTEEEIKEEFLQLSATRGQIWFDVQREEIERSWREDFKPNFTLIQENLVRNPNCVAFEYNSVGSYYNGSLIKCCGLNFLALEGPSERTLSRFFFALLDTNAPLLVCLTGEKEKNREKCTPYWLGRHLENDLLAIPRHEDRPKTIGYLFTEEWNDHSGGNPELILNLVLKARSIYDPSKGPLAVHCSGGVGRTGTFIAAYCLLNEIDKQLACGVPLEQLIISVEEIVAHLSLQRYHMVARASQYFSLYQVIHLYLEKYF